MKPFEFIGKALDAFAESNTGVVFTDLRDGQVVMATLGDADAFCAAYIAWRRQQVEGQDAAALLATWGEKPHGY